MEEHILFKYHNEIGNVGRDKMLDIIAKSYWFPNAKDKWVSHINNCLKFVAFSPNTGKKGFLNSIPKGSPLNLSTLTIMVQSVREDQRNIYLSSLVVLESLYVYVPQRQQIPEELSQPLWIILEHTASPSSLFQIEEEFDIKHSGQVAQGNGQVERINRSLGPMIAKLVEPEKGRKKEEK